MRESHFAAAVALVLVAGAAAALGAPDPRTGRYAADAGAVRWDARAAEHLLNRAGFGAGRDEIARAVELGHARTVELLLGGAAPLDPTGPGADDEPFWAGAPRRPPRELLADATPAERGRLIARYRREDEQQMLDHVGWWIERMVAGRDPLRERMVLFWHGHFTSSYREVRHSRAMIRQNALFREHALGSFAELLHAIVRDPAMLQYLDNDSNRRGEPNENLARELLELFALGEGNYGERDVQEAARALTGWWAKGDEFRVRPGRHDRGKKRILGRRGRFDADELVDLLLEQPACAEWVAGKLLAYFEGRPPPPERVAAYAGHLRAEDWSVASFLRRLFLDHAFYADDVVGARIASPVDYLVGACRRLGAAPPGHVLALAAGYLGERLMDPPNVQGWEGGEAWITTSSYIARGNLAGVLVGVLTLDDVLAEPASSGPGSSAMVVDGPDGMAGGPGSDDDPDTGGGTPVGTDGPAALDDEAGSDGEAGMRDDAEPTRPRVDRALRQMRKFRDRTRRPRIYLAERLARRGLVGDEEVALALLSDLLPVAVSEPSRASVLAFVAAQRDAAGIAPGELLASPRDAEEILRRAAHLVLSLPEAHLQ